MKWYLRMRLSSDNEFVLWCDEAEAVDTAMVVSRAVKQHVWLVDAHSKAVKWVGPTGVKAQDNG